MGLAYERFRGEPPSFVDLHGDGMYLMLEQVDHPKRIVPDRTVCSGLCNVYCWVSDADALSVELQRRGATIDWALCDPPYGSREFGVQGLDGYDIGLVK